MVLFESWCKYNIGEVGNPRMILWGNGSLCTQWGKWIQATKGNTKRHTCPILWSLMIFVAHPYIILLGATGNVDLKWGAIVGRSGQEKSTRSEGVLPLHRASTSWTNSTPAPPLDSTLITLLQDQSPPTIHSLYTSARPRQRLTSCPNSNVVNSKGQYFEYNDFRYSKHIQYFTPELLGFFLLMIFKLVKQFVEKLLLPWLSQSPTEI